MAVRSSLTEIAQALAAQPPARDARLPAENQPPAEDLSTLLARAEDFYRTGTGFTRHFHELLSGPGALLHSTYQVIRSQPADARLAARLVNSVAGWQITLIALGARRVRAQACLYSYHARQNVIHA